MVVLTIAKQPGNAAVVRTTASKAATLTGARVAIAMKLIGQNSTDIAGPEPNTPMIVHAAPEKEERGSNSNRGSDEAGIAVAFDKRAREQLDAAFQRKREEIDAAALAKKKRKLEEKRRKRKQQPSATARRRKMKQQVPAEAARKKKRKQQVPAEAARKRKRTQRAPAEAARKRKRTQQHQKALPWRRRRRRIRNRRVTTA